MILSNYFSKMADNVEIWDNKNCMYPCVMQKFNSKILISLDTWELQANKKSVYSPVS